MSAPSRGGRYGNDGVLDIHLAVSRDGILWQRPSPRPYIALGQGDAPDTCMQYMFTGLVRRSDRLLHYYCGYRATHGAHPDGVEMEPGAICLAEQRLDGFVSLHAGACSGWLLTSPIRFAGSRLELNVATAVDGECRVAVCDDRGSPHPGFALDDCGPVREDSTAFGVTWSGGRRLGDLAGEPVRLRFELRNADLYALQFC